MTKFKTMLAIIATTAMTAPAAAAIVYNNGAPSGTNGNDATAWVQAEDFTLGANTSITGAGVYIAGFDGIGNFDGQLQYYIFANSGGTPGAVLASGNVAPTVTDTGTAWDFGGNTFLLQFNFTSAFAAAASTTYFFGFHASTAGDFNRDDIYWVNTADNASATRGVESFGGTFDNWSGNGVEHAFYLIDDAANGAVPEPGTWAMMIGGFGAIGGAMRYRRRKVSVSFA